MIESHRDPFSPLGTMLGYVMAILGIAMLIHSFRQMSSDSQPSAFAS
jgi:hypothetical protein